MSSQIRVPERPDKEKKPKLPQIFVPALPDKPPLVIDGEEQILERDKLKPGDVLLSSSTIERDPYGYIPWLVRKLDQDWYSHAAFFDGKNVIESGLSGGVQRIDLKKVIDRNRYTDVYRFESDACRTEGHKSAKCCNIGDDLFPIEPLKKVADEYVNKPYARYDAILLGLLILKQQTLTVSPFETLLIKSVMMYLNYKAKSLPGKAALTCSELIYRIFDQADPGGKYRLIIGEKRDANAPFSVGRLTAEIVEPTLPVTELAAEKVEPTLLVTEPTFEINVAKILSTAQAPGFAVKGDSGQRDDISGLENEIRDFAENYWGLDQGLVSPVKSMEKMWSKLISKVAIKLTHNANMISPSDLRNSGNLREIGRLRKA